MAMFFYFIWHTKKVIFIVNFIVIYLGLVSWRKKFFPRVRTCVSDCMCVVYLICPPDYPAKKNDRSVYRKYSREKLTTKGIDDMELEQKWADAQKRKRVRRKSRHNFFTPPPPLSSLYLFLAL